MRVADRASARGGVWVRRGLVAITFFAIVVAPFIVAFTDIGVRNPKAKQDTRVPTGTEQPRI
jgi:hypothetical protein